MLYISYLIDMLVVCQIFAMGTNSLISEIAIIATVLHAIFVLDNAISDTIYHKTIAWVVLGRGLFSTASSISLIIWILLELVGRAT